MSAHQEQQELQRSVVDLCVDSVGPGVAGEQGGGLRRRGGGGAMWAAARPGVTSQPRLRCSRSGGDTHAAPRRLFPEGEILRSSATGGGRGQRRYTNRGSWWYQADRAILTSLVARFSVLPVGIVILFDWALGTLLLPPC
jgi:hypothetical protein